MVKWITARLSARSSFMARRKRHAISPTYSPTAWVVRRGPGPGHTSRSLSSPGQPPSERSVRRPRGQRRRHEADAHVHVYAKGAPDVLLPQCNSAMGDSGPHPLQDRQREKIEHENMDFGARGLRGLRVACQVLPVTEFNTSCDLARYVTDLTFLGLPGMMDPPRPEVTDAIKRCNDAGIAVTMITGAHKSTATAIARELGLEGDARAGIELDRLDPTENGP